MTLSGVGLHTGDPVKLTFKPASGEGIWFHRVDLPDSEPILADVSTVSGVQRRTELSDAGAVVGTIEHVLAAAAGLQVDDLLVELDGPEPPIGDGSAQEFVRALTRAGIVETNRPAREYVVSRPLSVEQGDSRYEVTPGEGARIGVDIEWDHPLIGHQSFSLKLTPESFTRDLAGARTFGFLAEADDLRAAGLIAGASEHNVIALSEDSVVGTELRWTDEFARHKALDLLGDLALLGGRFTGQIHAHRPSHRGNVAVTERIKAEADSRTVLDVEDIMAVLPHRYPMLLVDRIVEIEHGKRIVGIKNVTINEPFFQGHFPGHPVMPGVLVVEAMAQAGGMMMMNMVDDPQDKVVYFMSMDKVKFRQPVVPGDQLRFELELIRFSGKVCKMKGVTYVEGKKVAEAELMAGIVDR